MAKKKEQIDIKFIPAVAMTLTEYRCGVCAGTEVRLKRVLAVRDHKGRITRTHRIGEIWRVLTGNPSEPNVVRLRQPNGRQHTWDDDKLLSWFKPVVRRAARKRT